jgi:hypothetical protein
MHCHFVTGHAVDTFFSFDLSFPRPFADQCCAVKTSICVCHASAVHSCLANLRREFHPEAGGSLNCDLYRVHPAVVF